MDSLFLDGGVAECAYSRYSRGLLTEVGFWSANAVFDGQSGFHLGAFGSSEITEVAIEIPQLDDRPPLYVVPLTLHAALIAGAYRCPVYVYTPSKKGKLSPKQPGDLLPWKGTLEKPVHHHRVWGALTPAERALFPAGTEARIAEACRKGGLDAWRKPGAAYYGAGKGSECHNLLDAAALGLHHLGRYSEVK